MSSVGDGSWLWSTASYAAGNPNAGDMGFRSSNVNPLNNDNRANALSVRCVQHLPKLLFIQVKRIADNREAAVKIYVSPNPTLSSAAGPVALKARAAEDDIHNQKLKIGGSDCTFSLFTLRPAERV